MYVRIIWGGIYCIMCLNMSSRVFMLLRCVSVKVPFCLTCVVSQIKRGFNNPENIEEKNYPLKNICSTVLQIKKSPHPIFFLLNFFFKKGKPTTGRYLLSSLFCVCVCVIVKLAFFLSVST